MNVWNLLGADSGSDAVRQVAGVSKKDWKKFTKGDKKGKQNKGVPEQTNDSWHIIDSLLSDLEDSLPGSEE